MPNFFFCLTKWFLRKQHKLLRTSKKSHLCNTFLKLLGKYGWVKPNWIVQLLLSANNLPYHAPSWCTFLFYFGIKVNLRDFVTYVLNHWCIRWPNFCFQPMASLCLHSNDLVQFETRMHRKTVTSRRLSLRAGNWHSLVMCFDVIRLRLDCILWLEMHRRIQKKKMLPTSKNQTTPPALDLSICGSSRPTGNQRYEYHFIRRRHEEKNKLVLLSRACPFDDLVREGIQLKLMILGFGLRLSAYVSLFLTHYVMTNKYSF